jgi:hypothetical protein
MEVSQFSAMKVILQWQASIEFDLFRTLTDEPDL